MKECKDDAILPCYRDGYGVWHYSDETHDKVYELNKQMCDLGKTMNDPFEPLSEEAIQEIAKALEITRNPKDIMEEKKTKKMTKAEAFEWLKCKKVYCYDGTNTFYCKLVKKMLACGCDYKGFMCPHNYSVSALAIDREGRVGHVPTEVFERYINLPFEAISADDILSIEIVEEEEDTSMPTVEFERYVKILQAWSKRINSSFVFSERGMGIVRGDLLTKLEGEEKGAYYKIEATL